MFGAKLQFDNPTKKQPNLLSKQKGGTSRPTDTMYFSPPCFEFSFTSECFVHSSRESHLSISLFSLLHTPLILVIGAERWGNKRPVKRYWFLDLAFLNHQQVIQIHSLIYGPWG
jgi:hypothetical protein